MTPTQILSNITHFMKYAKYLPEKNRRETFEETCMRNRDMHIQKFPVLTEAIIDIYNHYVVTKKILPSMRSMQFAGTAIAANEVRMFNCSFVPIVDVFCFSEAMFLLLSGVGVGYSVQRHHIDQLPKINKPVGGHVFVIPDSIEGWAEAIRVLLTSYFEENNPTIAFDYSLIRERGMQIVTSGGKAPGAQPLRDCIHNITQILNKAAENQRKLLSIEVHSILCFIANAVLSGGIRRSSCISLFDFDDILMKNAKKGEWYITNPEFAMANNSAVLPYETITKKMFSDFWEEVEEAKSGEPGIYWTNNKEMGTNPCGEAALRPFSFCNLVEINAEKIVSQDDFNSTCAAASFLNTLQASYTNFKYLRPIWKKTTEQDALIGVGLTGISSGKLDNLDLIQASKQVQNTNKITAAVIGINPAARCCLIKPSGTASLVLGTAYGIHEWYAKFFIRRLRITKTEPIYAYLIKVIPELIEDDFYNPSTTAILSIPQKAPELAIVTENSSALTLANRCKKFNEEWVRPSHNEGDNFHNVSATIYIKNNEWFEMGEWLWDNKNSYHGLTVFPTLDNSYKQLPLEECTEDIYNTMIAFSQEIDLTQVLEESDNTTLVENIACAGGQCSI